MAVKLSKGQGISLRKSESDLSEVTIGLGWDIAEEKSGGFLSGLFSAKPAEYDLDVVAMLCGSNGKINDLGQNQAGQVSLKNSDVIFFNNLNHHTGCVRLTGDNRTGAGDGDDEQIIVRLNDLPDKYSSIRFIVQIYEGNKNKQSFGQVKNAFIRAVDRQGHELVRFDLSGSQYQSARSMWFAELVRESGGWHFRAVGEPSDSDSFIHWLRLWV